VQLIQALAAGNSVLLKPGVGGTASALALRELINRAGFDSMLVSLLPESTEAVRIAIEARPDKVLFTGSAATGEKILLQLATQVIPVTMELSGSDAVVVRSDADLDLVIKALVFGLTLNGGATCMTPRRVFIHRSIATELEGRLARAFPIELSLRLAPAHSAFLRPMIEEALTAGVHLIAGGLHDDGSVLGPVVLGGATRAHGLLQEDMFAPVLVVVTVANDDEAVTLANDCPFALGASVFTRDNTAARRLGALLNVGVVSINDLIVPTADAHVPFGGRKRSGFGVTRGAEGLLDLTAPKVITLNRTKFRPAFDPPHPKDEAMFQAYLALTHGRSFGLRARGLVALFKSLSGRTRHSNQSTS
jgi:acyl-CoA reductase-like NAD-dependent aldehyde dehydrogenase